MSPSTQKSIPKTTIALVLVVSLGLVNVVKPTPDTTVKSIGCSDNTYNSSDPYAYSLAYVFMALMDVTPSTQGYDYHTVSPYPTAPCYGHATCNQNLTNADCANCLIAAKPIIENGCPSHIGAELTLNDCFMKYDDHKI